MTILVTGGAGFIGSNFVHHQIKKYGNEPIVVLDALTYAGDKKNLDPLLNHLFRKVTFIHGNICDRKEVNDIFNIYNPRAVVHFAAESHVDRSILNSDPFLQTNIIGTDILLSRSLKHCNDNSNFKFVHVSTDEVYGSLDSLDPASTEEDAYRPRSPYAASKAASDHIAMAYLHTHNLPVVVTNCSNNYGPRQHREKFIPTIIRSLIEGKQIPVYGSGTNIRDWLYVDDHCDALSRIVDCPFPIVGKFNIGGTELDKEMSNYDLASMICTMMGFVPDDKITYVEDRKGHDFRYAINSDKIQQKLRWHPKVDLYNGLKKTIAWYTNEQDSRNNSSGWEEQPSLSSHNSYD